MSVSGYFQAVMANLLRQCQRAHWRNGKSISRAGVARYCEVLAANMASIPQHVASAKQLHCLPSLGSQVPEFEGRLLENAWAVLHALRLAMPSHTPRWRLELNINPMVRPVACGWSVQSSLVLYHPEGSNSPELRGTFDSTSVAPCIRARHGCFLQSGVTFR